MLNRNLTFNKLNRKNMNMNMNERRFLGLKVIDKVSRQEIIFNLIAHLHINNIFSLLTLIILKQYTPEYRSYFLIILGSLIGLIIAHLFKLTFNRLCDIEFFFFHPVLDKYFIPIMHIIFILTIILNYYDTF